VRSGVFGGSFDPVHYGHLLMAECCREHCELDRILFVPTAQSPHKLETVPASASDRLEMLKLAVGGHSLFDISSFEIDKGGVSYSVDLLEHLRTESPEDELFFLMGADTLAEFGSWRQPKRICELVTPVVVSRPGAAAPEFDSLSDFVSEERLAELHDYHVHMPQIDISSTEIRARVSSGKSIRFQLPRAVEEYIRSNKLYFRDEED